MHQMVGALVGVTAVAFIGPMIAALGLVGSMTVFNTVKGGDVW
jgi:hypothetical protein